MAIISPGACNKETLGSLYLKNLKSLKILVEAVWQLLDIVGNSVCTIKLSVFSF